MVERPARRPAGRGVLLRADRGPLGGRRRDQQRRHRAAVGRRRRSPPSWASTSEEELLDLAAQAPVGSGGLIMLPYLLSERAPHWSALPRGAYVGLTHGHRREHLVRAALEGVCQQLALVLTLGAGGRQRGPARSGPAAASPAARCGGRSSPTRSACRCASPPATRAPASARRCSGMQALGLIPSHRRRRRPGPDRRDGPPRPGRRRHLRGPAAALRRAVRRARARLHVAAPAGARPARRATAHSRTAITRA